MSIGNPSNSEHASNPFCSIQTLDDGFYWTNTYSRLQVLLLTCFQNTLHVFLAGNKMRLQSLNMVKSVRSQVKEALLSHRRDSCTCSGSEIGSWWKTTEGRAWNHPHWWACAVDNSYCNSRGWKGHQDQLHTLQEGFSVGRQLMTVWRKKNPWGEPTRWMVIEILSIPTYIRTHTLKTPTQY